MQTFAIAVLIGATAVVSSDMHPEIAKERWRYANHICWNAETLDGRAVSDTEIKVACISAGVFTERLLKAGYCLHAQRNEWEPCP